MAKSEKKAAVQPGSGKAASGKSSGAETPPGKDEAGSKNTLFIIGAVAAAILVGGLVYWKTSSNGNAGGPGPKTDPDLAALMAPGPLPEMALGSADAPNTIVEYASMTCPHCAQFENVVFPELKTKYIDTGKVRFIFREFPLDGLAARASLLARCAGPDRYFPMIEALFQTQQNWVVQGPEAMEKLLQFARQAGFSKESFDKCMADKELFNKIVEIRTTGYEKFGIELDALLLHQRQADERRARAQGFRGQARRHRQAGGNRRLDPASGRRFPDARRWRDADAARGQA